LIFFCRDGSPSALMEAAGSMLEQLLALLLACE